MGIEQLSTPLILGGAVVAAVDAIDQAVDNAKSSKEFNFANFKNRDKPPSSLMAYPSQLTDASDTDYIRFKFFKYNPPFGTAYSRGDIASYNRSVAEYKESATDGEGNNLQDIVMYMPEDIQATYGAQWGGKSIQNVTADVLGTAATGMSGTFNAATLLSGVAGAGTAAGEALLIGATKKAMEALQKTGQAEGLGINDVFGATAGVVLNPNTELLFSGFNLRTFNLNFKLVAQSKEDAKTIRNIITTFKKAMLPSLGKEEQSSGFDGVSFITVPALCDVKFMSGSTEHPFITQFKPCAITGMNLNYTTDGSYATYEDGAPVAIGMNLEFSETKLVYKEDIQFGGPSY